MANRTISEKITRQKQKKKVNNNNKSQEVKKSRFLITVNVVGSPGPIKLVVNEDSLVVEVIDTVLKTYAREERLPILGSNPNNFLLYCANAGIDGTILFPITHFLNLFHIFFWVLDFNYTSFDLILNISFCFTNCSVMIHGCLLNRWNAFTYITYMFSVRILLFISIVNVELY